MIYTLKRDEYAIAFAMDKSDKIRKNFAAPRYRQP